MKKLASFVLVGLAFVALQVATVEADPNTTVDLSHCDQFEGAPKAACIAVAESGPPPENPCPDMTGAALTACMEANRDHPENPCPDMTGTALTACMEANRDHPENPCLDMTGAALTACMEANQDQHEDHGENCAALSTPALVAECVARKTGAGR